MSSPYDPRRSRPRPTPIPDPEAAPIDALLGPEPEPGAIEPASPDLVARPGSTAGPDSLPPRPIPAPRSGAPSPALQLAPLLLLTALVLALVWWLTRRRRGSD
jgi:hypothetical protein